MIFIRECDYITIHVPLMDSTKGMIGADAIAQMKPSVVVLNLARGPLVDQKAIVEALKTNRIRKYVTDFPNSRCGISEKCHRDPASGCIYRENLRITVQ